MNKKIWLLYFCQSYSHDFGWTNLATSYTSCIKNADDLKKEVCVLRLEGLLDRKDRPSSLDVYYKELIDILKKVPYEELYNESHEGTHEIEILAYSTEQEAIELRDSVLMELNENYVPYEN